MTIQGTRLVYFKVVNTERKIQYNVRPDWKVTDFINIMKTRIIRDFGIEEFELVEAGQNTHSGRAEEGLALNRSDTTCLREKYGDRMDVSFYIRPIREWMECVVCFEPSRAVNYYQCIHSLCSGCLIGCFENNIRYCPMCRCENVRN
jgi:hypothetical protein